MNRHVEEVADFSPYRGDGEESLSDWMQSREGKTSDLAKERAAQQRARAISRTLSRLEYWTSVAQAETKQPFRRQLFHRAQLEGDLLERLNADALVLTATRDYQRKLEDYHAKLWDWLDKQPCSNA